MFLVVGTLLSNGIALLVAVPVGVGAAVFLAETVPGQLRIWLSFFVELLAAIPSVVFGLWGYVVVIPFFGHHVFPVLAHALGFIPIFAGPVGERVRTLDRGGGAIAHGRAADHGDVARRDRQSAGIDPRSRGGVGCNKI